MKRDLELFKLILLEYEKLPAPPHGKFHISVPGFSKDQVAYHQMLLLDAGLIVGKSRPNMNEPYAFQAQRLTNQGHEFLDQIKNDTVWNKVKAQIIDTGGQFSIELLKILAAQYFKSLFGV